MSDHTTYVERHFYDQPTDDEIAWYLAHTRLPWLAPVASQAVAS